MGHEKQATLGGDNCFDCCSHARFLMRSTMCFRSISVCILIEYPVASTKYVSQCDSYLNCSALHSLLPNLFQVRCLLHFTRFSHVVQPFKSPLSRAFPMQSQVVHQRFRGLRVASFMFLLVRAFSRAFRSAFVMHLLVFHVRFVMSSVHFPFALEASSVFCLMHDSCTFHVRSPCLL